MHETTSDTVAGTQAQSAVGDFHEKGQAGSPTTTPINRSARYVRVQLENTDGVLSLAEVEVVGTIPAALTNLSLAGVASQSTTTNNGEAGRANDGNTNGHWTSGSVTHTASIDSQPYWNLDLGAVKTISSIQLYNRTDCCSDRLTDFHVFVSNVPFTGTTVADSAGQSGVFNYHNTGTAVTTTEIGVNRSGRYVRVQLANTTPGAENVLSLAEVEVMGE